MVTFIRIVTIAFILLSITATASAERQPVLRQIAVPHDYYFREMYLPQVSSGPQSPAWSPDGESLVYSMQGSLWRQSVSSATAVQLTAGSGYDHQPDWSPDGEHIVFTRYIDDAMELQLLNLATGSVISLTEGGDVNLEPRWSPDGSRLAFVSTSGTGRFHVFVGDLKNGALSARQLVDERQSEIERYYYGEFDHEINPVWDSSGSTILYVSNPETPYGTGSIWRKSLNSSDEPVLVRREETSWRTRPDIAADGRRVIYSSYLGRQWHQLWITSLTGKGEPFPLTYGDYDVSSARWSPGGERIAFGVNEFGNTVLRILELPGGKTTELEITDRQYLRATGTVQITVSGQENDAIASRISIVGADGRFYGPHDRWLHADDSFDRGQRSEELRYFHADGTVGIDLPAGPASITVWRGLETRIERREIKVEARERIDLDIQLQPLSLPDAWNDWHSADVHVHMNYGGIYRNTPANLVRQGEAEDLDLIFNLIVNKEQRVPDRRHFSGQADEASTGDLVLQHSQEFHTGYWGHLGLLGLSEHLLLPDYSAYPETAAASLYPDNVAVEDFAHQQNAIAGYVHPFMYPLPDPVNDLSLTNALPIDAALGKIDFYEVVGFADHRASAEIWYRLLNCGFRISAAGGTDAMANYASLHGPVGMNRTYVQAEEWPASAGQRRDIWIQSLKAGRSIATNGPLVGLTVNGMGPGSVVDLGEAGNVSYQGFMRSVVPIDKVEVVFNGKVMRTIEPTDDAMAAEIEGTIAIGESGWLLLRAANESPHPEILDIYPYATTSPVYIEIDGAKPESAEDSEYFLAWIERIKQSASAHQEYNSAGEKEQVMKHIDDAIAVFEKQIGTARVDR